MSSDGRVGETTRFTYRPNTEWYWFPQQKLNEVSMVKCYDSATDRVGTQQHIRNETISQHAVSHPKNTTWFVPSMPSSMSPIHWALRDLATCMRPGGRLCVVVPSRDSAITEIPNFVLNA